MTKNINNLPSIDTIELNGRDAYNPIRRLRTEMADNDFTEVQPQQLWLLKKAVVRAVDVAGMLSEYCPDEIGVAQPTGRGYQIIRVPFPTTKTEE